MNFNEIKSAVSDWLARNDIDVQADRFVEFAENRINRALKIRHQETSIAELIKDDGTVEVPDDFDQWRTVFVYPGTPGLVLVDAFVVNTRNRGDISFAAVADTMTEMRVDSPENMWRRYPPSVSGRPCYLTRVGDQFYVGPKPDGNYTLAGYYYRNFPRLSETEPTNWLSDNNSDAYVFGALAEASAYIKDEKQYLYWNSRFELVLNELQAESELEKHAGSSLTQVVA